MRMLVQPIRAVDDATRDLRHAGRALRRSPGFAISIVATLALGIAAAASVLSVAYEVLLRPLPVRDQDRVVVMWADNTMHAPQHVPLSLHDLPSFAHDTRALESVASYEFNGALPQFVQFADTTVSVDNALVSGAFFDVLGVRPIAGRLLQPADDQPGAEPVIVIGETFWRRTLGANPNVVGSVARIVGKPARIVGVVPNGLSVPGGAQAWLPINAYATMSGAAPDIFAVDLVGRLRRNATAAQAAAELDAFLQRPDPAHMSLERRIVKFLRPSVTPLADTVVGSVRPTIIAVTAAALLLLIVTCVSAANLVMVRALGRERELVVRLALGAGRWRIGRQLLAESGLIAAASVIAGLSLSFILLRLFARFAPANLPRFDGGAIHLPVLLAIALCCAIVTIGVSLLPVITRVGRDVGDVLRGRATGERLASARGRRVLVISQVAVSVCALVGAGLFLRSFIALGQVNLGFQPAQVIFARVAPSPSNVKSLERLDATIDEVVRRVAELPGVLSATPVMSRPFTGTGGWDFPYSLPGEAVGSRPARPMLNVYLAGPGYFETLGTRLVAGRMFDARDDANAPPVVIVDEQIARTLWPGESAIGKRIGVGREANDLQTVVGVVENTRYRELLSAWPTAYMPFHQFTRFPPGYIAVRVRGDPTSVERSLRSIVGDVDPGVFLPLVTTLDRLAAAPLATPKLNSILLIAFAASIALLAAIGLYGLLAASVRTRRFELAVRLALGAEPRGIAELVLRQGLGVFVVGGAIGLAVAVIGGRFAGSIVYGARAGDPLTLAASVVLVAGIVLIASWIPARRAACVRPSEALRGE